MSERNDGGPAFPEAYWATPQSDAPSYRSGMSLRDYFAAKALPVVMDSFEAPPDARGLDRNKLAGAIAVVVSRWSYAIADAMLAERAKSATPEPAKPVGDA